MPLILHQRPAVAKLRLLLVEPPARGQGLGTRLVEGGVRFATPDTSSVHHHAC